MTIGSQDELGYEDAFAWHTHTVRSQDYVAVKNHLLTAINITARNAADQRIATDMTARMELAGQDFNEIILALATYLSDLATRRTF